MADTDKLRPYNPAPPPQLGNDARYLQLELKKIGSSLDAVRQVMQSLEASGVIVGRAYAENTTSSTISAVIPLDDTIPQVTEGTQILSASITPKSTTNRVRGRLVLGVNAGVGALNATAAVFVNGAANAIAASFVFLDSINVQRQLAVEFEHVPASTTPQAYTVRLGTNSSGNPVVINGVSSTRLLGGVSRATLVLDEIQS